MKPLKIWTYLDNFFFVVSKGTKGKIAKTIHWFLRVFFPLVPLGKYEKRCLKELSWNFVRFQKILNPAFAENFSCLSHWKVRNPHPLYKLGTSWTSHLIISFGYVYFVPLPWKLDNPYYHILGALCRSRHYKIDGPFSHGRLTINVKMDNPVNLKRDGQLSSWL